MSYNTIFSVREPLRKVNSLLVDLLGGLSAEEWSLPTVHPGRDVKDLAVHLLHGSLRRVSSLRDHYRRPTPPITGIQDLIDFIQADNREFMQGMRRISPRIVAELIAIYDAHLLALFEQLDPDADGLGVAWAGESTSKNWFDMAREYTEKWHHQQQIRDATTRPPLYEVELFRPVLETFARGLPFAFRNAKTKTGSVSIRTSGHLELSWTIRRGDNGWFFAEDPETETTITLPADTAWRVWTKGIDRETARNRTEVNGDEEAVEPVLTFVAVMA